MARDARALARGVPDVLYRRHLGLPADAPVDELVARLAAAARGWYSQQGSPWLGVSLVRIEAIEEARITLAGGAAWTSERLARELRERDAGTAAVIGASAGAAVDAEIEARWRDGCPDEAVFLSAFAASVAEHLRDEVEADLRRAFASDGFQVLPRWSPGYPGWDLADQAAVFAALEDPGPIRLHPSGALAPVRSTLTVCGIGDACAKEPAPEAPRRSEGPAAYRLPERALAKWARERLVVERGEDGRIAAQFRFDGTTCASLGVPIAMTYRLDLAADRCAEPRITGLSCEPVPGREGYRAMCAFHADPGRFGRRMLETPSLVGRTLEEALAWDAPFASSGCLCDEAHRAHKWRIALETLHYRLKKEPIHGK